MSTNEPPAPTAFGHVLAPDVSLEASVLRRPLRGATTAVQVLAAAGDTYETFTVTHRAASEGRVYLENTATFGGTPISSVVVFTLDDQDRIDSIAVHHRPFDAVLAFSAAMGDRLVGTVDRSFFHQL